MGYYDVYDSNDNLIASEVWIDDGLNSGPARPIVINYRKVLMVLLAFIGFVNTFVLPIILFINKDAFIKGGWLLSSIPSIIIGLPVFIVFISMLKTLKKVKNNEGLDKKILDQAKSYVNSKIMQEESIDDIDDDVSDEEYINKHKAKYKYDVAVSRVYLTIKFERLLKAVSNLSYLVYPIGILTFVAEFIYGSKTTYMIILGILNYLVFFLLFLSVYKNYKTYKIRYAGNIIKRMICVALATFALGVCIAAIFMSAYKVGGFSVLCVFAMLFDLAALIDSKKVVNKAQKNSKIHILPIVVITIIYGIIALFIGCGLALIPGPIYNAIIAYDAGLSKDLSLPITVWSICGAVAIILIIITSIIVHKKINNKSNS